jgi:hypothetical protein
MAAEVTDELTEPETRASKMRTIQLRMRPPVIIDDVPGLGKVEMRDISIGVSRDVRELVRASSAPARTFAAELARNVITDPDLSDARPDELIPDDAWPHIALALASTTGITEWYQALPDEMDPRDRLYQADQDRWEQWARELRVSLQPAMQEITSLFAANMPAIQAAARGQWEDARTTIGSIASSLGKAHLQGMAGMIADISQSFASVNALAVDRALLKSGINSALIHTPTYVPPRVALPSAIVAATPFTEAAERDRMLNAYDVLVRLEQALRRFIARRLEEHAGSGWRKQRVPAPVQTNCQLSRAGAAKGEDKPLIDYAHMGEYRDIILRRDNWREVFQPVFGSKAQVEAFFEWCTEARIEIGHSRPLENDLWTAFNFAARRLIAAVEN